MNLELSQRFHASIESSHSNFIYGNLDDTLEDYEKFIKQNTSEAQGKEYIQIRDKIFMFSELQSNWDSYNADSVCENAINVAMKVLDYMYNYELLSNDITINVFPMRDGGIQFEFDGENLNAELEINQNEEMNFILFDANGNILDEEQLFELSELSTFLEDAQYA